MKIRRVLLVALVALVLGAAAFSVRAPAIAGGRGGMTGEFRSQAGIVVSGPAIAGAKPGVASGSSN